MDVVVPGTEPIQADLVFVHGLRGDRIKTWESDKVFWPRDLLPKDLPNVRIMSYGYDANVMNFFSNKKRPIIFIGHSLGGLVIKDSLCKSNHYRDNPHHQRTAAIYRSTYGIVFLGTPHRGGNHTAWASIATNFATTVLKDHNSKVVDALKRGSETLERIQDSFCNVVGQIRIWSYFEDLGYGAAGKIVDDDSATLGLPSERKEWIRANHSDICKFSNEDDYGYISVYGGISELVEDAVLASTNGSSTVLQEQVLLPTRAKPVPPLSSSPKAKGADFQAQNKMLKNATSQVPSSMNRNIAPPTSGHPQVPNNSTSLPGPTYAKKIPSQYHKANDDAFIQACEENDVETARRLLESGTSPDTISRDGDPALWIAYGSCDDDTGSPLLKLLLQFKADTEVDLHGGETLLICVAFNGDLSSTHTLLQHGANPDASDKDDWTPLMHAAKGGHVDVVRALLEAGANVKALNKDGSTPLIFAIAGGRMDVIRALLNERADVNALNRDGMTPLMYAARYGHMKIIQALPQEGAEVNASSKDGVTPLMYAAIRGDVDIVRALLREGADVSASNKIGVTAFMYAVRDSHVDVIRALLKAGADVNASDHCDTTPLVLAAKFGHVGAIQVLLHAKANVNAQSCGGETALRIILREGVKSIPNGQEVLDVLVAAGGRA